MSLEVYKADLALIEEHIGRPCETYTNENDIILHEKVGCKNAFLFGTRDHFASLTHNFNVEINPLVYQLELDNAKAIESNNGYWQIEEYHNGHLCITTETVRPIVDSDPFPKMKEFLLRHGYIEQLEANA